MKVKAGRENNQVYVEIQAMPELNNAIKGLKLLGYEVENISFPYAVYLDVDTKYYHRFDELVIEKLYRSLTNHLASETNITYRNNRLYVNIDGQEIILPNDIDYIHDLLNKHLVVCLTLKEIDN